MNDAYLRLEILRLYPEAPIEEIKKIYEWVSEKNECVDDIPF